MTIWLFVEGKTEMACRRSLKAFMDGVAVSEARDKVRLDTQQYKGSAIWDAERVAQDARDALRSPGTTGVVVLVDVWPEFLSAEAATQHYMQRLRHDRFRAHCALHGFEAWLLPHWERLYKLAGQPPRKAVAVAESRACGPREAPVAPSPGTLRSAPRVREDDGRPAGASVWCRLASVRSSVPSAQAPPQHAPGVRRL